MNTKRVHCLEIFILVFMTACKPIWHRPVSTPDALWQLRERNLATLNNWVINGRAAIVKGDKGWNVNVRWRQTMDNYQINLTGPFAQGGVILTGNEKQAMLFLGNGKKISSTSPEALLEENMKLKIPVIALRDWVRGLPYQDIKVDRMDLDIEGRVTSLKQQDWEIEILRYMPFKRYDMPMKIFIKHHDLTVKLIILNWEAVK